MHHFSFRDFTGTTLAAAVVLILVVGGAFSVSDRMQEWFSAPRDYLIRTVFTREAPVTSPGAVVSGVGRRDSSSLALAGAGPEHAGSAIVHRSRQGADATSYAMGAALVLLSLLGLPGLRGQRLHLATIS